MKKINFKQHVLPHLIALVLFLVIAVVFFNPVFFENKSIEQHDILQWKGSAKELSDYRDSTGEEGLWASSMFSGMPAYLVNTEFSGDLMAYVQEVYTLWLPHPVRLIFGAFVSFYILLTVFGVRPSLAMAGAIAYGLSSFNIISISAGHNAKVAAISFMPLVLAGIQLTFSRNRILGFGLTAIGLALHLRSNHLQITYYLLIIILIYWGFHLFYAIKDKTTSQYIKLSLLLIPAAILAVGANIGKVWTTYEYSRYSMRGPSELVAEQGESSPESGLEREYAFRYSNGILEPMTLIIPNFFGGASQQQLGEESTLAEAMRLNGVPPAQVTQQLEAVPTYWGDQPLTAPYYAGAIICFLFVLGLFVLDKPQKYWLLTATILSIMLSWGSNFETFNYFLFDYLPGYNKFRSVTFALTIALFCIPLLGFTGLENLVQKGLTPKTKKQLLYASGIAGGICLLILVFAGMASFRGAIDERLANLPGWFMNALREDRESLLRADALRSLFFIVAFAGVLYFYLTHKISAVIAFPIAILLVTIDLWLVDSRYFGDKNYTRQPGNEFFAKTEADQMILQDEEKNFRVFNLQNPWNEARTSYYYHSIGGYHGAKMRRYQDLIDHCLSEETNVLIQNLQGGNMNTEDYHILNMLNTKYLLAGTSRSAVIENKNARGAAWFVSNIQAVSSPTEELQTLCETDTEQTAIVDQSKFDLEDTDYSSTGNIQLAEYSPNYLKYESNNPAEGFAVFSEIYYPLGWKATIDGEEADILRANYVLRAMVIPPGEHTIEFTFAPQSYFTGNTIMMVTSALVILLFLGSVVISLRTTKETSGIA